jgi:hypothetical protein
VIRLLHLHALKCMNQIHVEKSSEASEDSMPPTSMKLMHRIKEGDVERAMDLAENE